MTAPAPDLPPYEPRRLLSAPFPERIRLVCRTWASQVSPNPKLVLAMYWAKYLVVFIGGWAFWVSFSAGYPGFLSAGWLFSDVAFQKFVVWAIAYEMLGLGCGWGPMNGRIKPPMGGFLHFLRPGTTKLPLFPGIPVFGNIRRGWLDVGLYAANLALLVRALVAPEITPSLLWPSCILIPLLGVTDKTLFLAARAEHYWVALVCLAVAAEGALWIPACKLIWCCIWFWAATSKVNHHFPSVILVMMNNGPFFPSWLKKRLFVSYPDDLRPSRLAVLMARAGTLTEYSLPFLLVASAGHPTLTALFLLLMAGFHGFIALNNPSGMPIEWNILMVYGGIFLFGVHPEAPLSALTSLPLLLAFQLFCMVAVPAFGNLFPSRVSFLLAMRYYAGNWAYNIWLFRKGTTKKLQKLTKASGTLREQLETMLPDRDAVDMACTLSLAHRFMHLEGRPLLEALPLAVDDLDDYEWIDGELVSGVVLGWNFGDGHLNDLQLLEAVQEQCGFEEGELRVVMVESQPLFGRTMKWRIADAAKGVIHRGESEIGPMRALAPWPTGPYADALLRRRPAAQTA
jgi:Transmembrane protein of unknown function (DUF3556)